MVCKSLGQAEQFAPRRRRAINRHAVAFSPPPPSHVNDQPSTHAHILARAACTRAIRQVRLTDEFLHDPFAPSSSFFPLQASANERWKCRSSLCGIEGLECAPQFGHAFHFAVLFDSGTPEPLAAALHTPTHQNTDSVACVHLHTAWHGRAGTQLSGAKWWDYQRRGRPCNSHVAQRPLGVVRHRRCADRAGVRPLAQRCRTDFQRPSARNMRSRDQTTTDTDRYESLDPLHTLIRKH